MTYSVRAIAGFFKFILKHARRYWTPSLCHTGLQKIRGYPFLYLSTWMATISLSPVNLWKYLIKKKLQTFFPHTDHHMPSFRPLILWHRGLQCLVEQFIHILNTRCK